jgi:hypothetical protein
MSQRKPVPVTEAPEFIVEGELDSERQNLIEQLQVTINNNPDFLLSTLSVYAKSPEAADSVLDLAKRFPDEWQPGLALVSEVFTSGIDKDMVYDKATQLAIDRDDELKKWAKEAERSNADRTALAGKIRRRQVAIFLQRMGKFRRQTSNSAA